MVTSPKSARVTEVRHLHDRRHRATRGAFVVEGPQAIESAVRAGRPISELFVTDVASTRHAALVDSVRASGARVTMATEEVLAAMAETRQPQGLIAVCELITVPLDQALASPAVPMIVILDRINDPGNAGTIIRTADACGATAIVMTPDSVDPHNGKCVRASAGSVFHVPISVDVPVLDAMSAARTCGARVVAAAVDGDMVLGTPSCDDLLAGPVAWLMGNEAQGLGQLERSHADVSVSIPMFGGAESLNLAAATAICLHATALAQHGR